MNNDAPPPWPWKQEADRIVHAQIRDRMLEDDWEEDLATFLEQVWGERKIGAVGVLDFSWNPIRILVSQLSEPGLWGARPSLEGEAGAEPLIGLNGLLDQAGYTEIMQEVEYRTRGLGDMFVRPIVRGGRLSLWQVKPWAVHVEVDPQEPHRVVELWHLCCYDANGEARWVWEIFSLRGQPSWRVEDAKERTRDGRPLLVTNLHYPGTAEEPGPPAEGWSGPDYPWRYATGEAYIPYVHYTTRRGSRFWNDWRLRGLHRGSFHAARLANTALYAADCAPQKAVVLVNCLPVGGDVKNSGKAGAVQSLELLPGTMVPMASDGDKQALVAEVGPGADIMTLWSVVRSMILSMLAAHGLRESDVVRTDANPTSAAALVISDRSRRQAQWQVRPHFRRADQELLGMCANLVNAATGGDLPEAGYRIDYEMIPKTSDELAAEREEEAFELERGLASKVGIYMRRKGVDRATAIEALAQIQRDNAAVEAAAQGGSNGAV